MKKAKGERRKAKGDSSGDRQQAKGDRKKSFNFRLTPKSATRYSLLATQVGTSLVEMMVLLSVMLIVLSLGLVEFGDFRERAARQRALESVAPLTKALELYKLEYSVYPDDTKAVTEVLLPYANVTSLVAQLRAPDIVTPTSSASVCVSAEVRDITPTYRVTHCGQPDDLNANNQTDVRQPVCLWTGTTWYPCQERL